MEIRDVANAVIGGEFTVEDIDREIGEMMLEGTVSKRDVIKTLELELKPLSNTAEYRKGIQRAIDIITTAPREDA